MAMPSEAEIRGRVRAWVSKRGGTRGRGDVNEFMRWLDDELYPKMIGLSDSNRYTIEEWAKSELFSLQREAGNG